jgi:hypothetical protein
MCFLPDVDFPLFCGNMLKIILTKWLAPLIFSIAKHLSGGIYGQSAQAG